MNKAIQGAQIFGFALISAIPDLIPSVIPTILHSRIVPFEFRKFIEEMMTNPLVPWQAFIFGFMFALAAYVLLPGKNTMQDVMAFGLIIPLVALILMVVTGFLGNILGVIHLRPDVFIVMVFSFFFALCARVGLHMEITPVGIVVSTLGAAAVYFGATIGLLPPILAALRHFTLGVLVGTFAVLNEE